MSTSAQHSLGGSDISACHWVYFWSYTAGGIYSLHCHHTPCMMALIEFLTCPEHDESHGIGFAWPAKTVLEDIALKRIGKTGPVQENRRIDSNGDVDGYINGSATRKRNQG